MLSHSYLSCVVQPVFPFTLALSSHPPTSHLCFGNPWCELSGVAAPVVLWSCGAAFSPWHRITRVELVASALRGSRTQKSAILTYFPSFCCRHIPPTHTPKTQWLLSPLSSGSPFIILFNYFICLLVKMLRCHFSVCIYRALCDPKIYIHLKSWVDLAFVSFVNGLIVCVCVYSTIQALHRPGTCWLL